MHVSLLTIGDEILIGQVVDTNSAWMGQQLNLAGYRVHSIYSVGDTLEAIQTGIRQAFGSADIVLVTGGLGPTKDDITKTALADFLVRNWFSTPLLLNGLPGFLKNSTGRYRKRTAYRRCCRPMPKCCPIKWVPHPDYG